MYINPLRISINNINQSNNSSNINASNNYITAPSYKSNKTDQVSFRSFKPVLGPIAYVVDLIDAHSNKTKELLEKQMERDQDNIFDANNYQLSRKQIKQDYEAELLRVYGYGRGLETIAGNNMLKLGLKRNVLLPLIKVIDGDMSIKNEIPNGICFFGPEGTGKTYLAKALGAHYKEKGGDFETLEFTGNDEQDITNMKRIFAEAEERYKESGNKKYTMILLDEIEKNAPDTDSDNAHIIRTAQLLALVNNCKARGVVFLSTTSDLSSSSKDLLRNGRTDLRIPVGTIELFDLADMIGHYIAKSSKKVKKIDYNEIIESVRVMGLSYKPEIIEAAVNKALEKVENYDGFDKIVFASAVLSSGLKLTEDEKEKLQKDEELAKKLGGLNDNARYDGENVPEVNYFRTARNYKVKTGPMFFFENDNKKPIGSDEYPSRADDWIMP